MAVIYDTKHKQPSPYGLEFDRLDQLILSPVITIQPINWSLDRRAPVERWSGHCQRLEEKMDEVAEEESEGHEEVSEQTSISVRPVTVSCCFLLRGVRLFVC